MRAHIISSIFTILFISGAGFAQVENPTPVTVCELKKNPDAYNHNLVRVQGAIDHEFEDFSIDDPSCPQYKSTPWLMYGGDVSDDVTYCCGNSSNKKSVEVEGIEIPIDKDEVLEKFRRLTNSYRINPKAKVHYAQTDPTFAVNATLVGRFFAGKPPVRSAWGRGYGHLGCCSLLAIQQVVSINRVSSNLKPGEMSCFTEGWNSSGTDAELIARQNELKKSGERWRYADFQRVAAEALSGYLKNPAPALTAKGCQIKHLNYEATKDQYAAQCRWTTKSADSYTVEVLKYSFLKNSSDAWKETMWMPAAITHQRCTKSAGLEGMDDPALH